MAESKFHDRALIMRSLLGRGRVARGAQGKKRAAGKKAEEITAWGVNQVPELSPEGAAEPEFYTVA